MPFHFKVPLPMASNLGKARPNVWLYPSYRKFRKRIT